MSNEEIRLEALKLAVNQYQFNIEQYGAHVPKASIMELFFSYLDLIFVSDKPKSIRGNELVDENEINQYLNAARTK